MQPLCENVFNVTISSLSHIQTRIPGSTEKADTGTLSSCMLKALRSLPFSFLPKSKLCKKKYIYLKKIFEKAAYIQIFLPIFLS